LTGYRLNPTAASLLGFLHDGPLTGWDVVDTAMSRVGDFWSLTRSQVYRELAAMAREGLVEAGPKGQRDSQPYAITDAGRAAFAEWASVEPGPETIRFPLLLLLNLGAHVPEETLTAAIEHHRAVHAERLASYEALAAAGQDAIPDPHQQATLGFGLAYERAVLSWFDQLPEILRASGSVGERALDRGRRQLRRRAACRRSGV
jgi:DNA-binding PadR family transcriptional regulator